MVAGMPEHILVNVAAGVATITLNRPDKMNAFTGQMMLDMIAAFDLSDADDNVKVVIVTGSGTRAFCAGADLSAGAKTFDYEARDDRPDRGAKESLEYLRDGGGRLTLHIFESLKPVIGAVNGAAVGVGVTMQLPMDIRIASSDAKFGFVFSRRGIVPEACSSYFLPRLVGKELRRLRDAPTLGMQLDAGDKPAVPHQGFAQLGQFQARIAAPIALFHHHLFGIVRPALHRGSRS